MFCLDAFYFYGLCCLSLSVSKYAYLFLLLHAFMVNGNSAVLELLFQSIYPAKILKLNFRERKENAWEDSGSDELSVVFPGVIARFDGADLQVCVKPSLSSLYYLYIRNREFVLRRQWWSGFLCMFKDKNWILGCSQNVLKKAFQDVKSRLWKDKFEEQDAEDEETFGRIPFQIWNVNKFSSCADAAIVGLMPPPLLELQVTYWLSFFYCW